MAQILHQKWFYRTASTVLIAVPVIAISLSIERQGGIAEAYAGLSSSVPTDLMDDLIAVGDGQSDPVSVAIAPADVDQTDDTVASTDDSLEEVALDADLDLSDSSSVDDEDALLANRMEAWDEETDSLDSFEDWSTDAADLDAAELDGSSAGDIALADLTEALDQTDQ